MQYTTLYRNIDASIMPLFVNTTHIVHMSVHFAFSLSTHCNYLPILNSYFVCRNSPVNAHCLVSMRSSSSNCQLQKSCSNSSLKNRTARKGSVFCRSTCIFFLHGIVVLNSSLLRRDTVFSFHFTNQKNYITSLKIVKYTGFLDCVNVSLSVLLLLV